MKRKITGIAAALTVLFGTVPQAAEVTSAEAVNHTVEDFDKMTD